MPNDLWIQNRDASHTSAEVSDDEGLLVARHIYKSFGETEVLHDVSVSVRKGDTLCIIGPSGAGKSTFVRCLNRLEVPSSGWVLIDGDLMGYRVRDGAAHELKPRGLRRQQREVGMVFQDFNLFQNMNALDNIAIGAIHSRGKSRDEAKRDALGLLERVGLRDRADAYPRELSGGQQQRVAIARSLAMKPKLMLFDEPTSALDRELVREVLNVMRELADDGMTMVVVTHELDFARQAATNVAFMADGRIVEQGSPSEVLDDPRENRTREFLAVG